MTDLVRSGADPAKRSVVSFRVTGDPWRIIDAWAGRHDFRLRPPEHDPRVKLYQKGSGFWTAPTRAQFTPLDEHTVELQAYIYVPFIARLFALFLLPEEMNVNSGSFRGMLPRSIARKAVNDLLASVGAPPIT